MSKRGGDFKNIRIRIKWVKNIRIRIKWVKI